ncbi:MAG TPA: pilus assembly protein TadG-related protein, partial [Geobacteraceae bacterium]|nr:pilus assembly protein TadG-related protein [Geobacteraceae bacterium]
MDTAKLTIIGNNKGFAIVYIVLAIFVLVGCLGLAIDLGHMYVVRGELQNAADATALAGAWALYRDHRNPDAAPALDFSRAQMRATNIINKNKSDGVSLADGTIETRCWDLTHKHLEPCDTPPTSHQVPAVVVTISRSAGNNGGPVPTFFAKVFGSNQTPVSSKTAVAVSGFPGSVPGGALFPMAISSCITDPFPNPGASITISIPHGPGGPGCFTGQWASFNL